MNKVREISKAIAATLTALGTWGVTAAADGSYDQVELWGLCGVAVVGLSTFYAPRNYDPIRSSKLDSNE